MLQQHSDFALAIRNMDLSAFFHPRLVENSIIASGNEISFRMYSKLLGCPVVDPVSVRVTRNGRAEFQIADNPGDHGIVSFEIASNLVRWVNASLNGHSN